MPMLGVHNEVIRMQTTLRFVFTAQLKCYVKNKYE